MPQLFREETSIRPLPIDSMDDEEESNDEEFIIDWDAGRRGVFDAANSLINVMTQLGPNLYNEDEYNRIIATLERLRENYS